MNSVALDISAAIIRISGVKPNEGEAPDETIMRGLAAIEERLKRSEAERKSNVRRVAAILDVVMRLASLDYSRKAEVTEAADYMDALAAGVNMLGEELKQSTISLKEKEVLLREIHHRVKNNLQVISSLLNLQAGQMEDEETRQQYSVSNERIRAMAMVHEKLYESKDLSGIDFGEYIKSLTHSLNISCNPDAQRIRLRVNIETGPAPLKIDHAVPCALILNELVMNGFKHAFSDGRTGEIEVTLRKDETGQRRELVISDNGVGIPAGFSAEESSSLGLQLVTVLAEQIDAELSVRREAGTSFTLSCRCDR